MEPTILGKTYEVVEMEHWRVWCVRQKANPLLRLWVDYQGKWAWGDGPIYYHFTSREQAERKARELHDKPTMTTEERKAKLIELGWEA